MGGGGPFDRGDFASVEQASAHEVCEAQDSMRDLVCSGGQTQQCISDHRSVDLQFDRVLIVAEKFPELEMLLDPSKQQFDLPAAFVKSADFAGRSAHIIGNEAENLAILAPNSNSAQRHRQLGVAFAGQGDLFVGQHTETLALRFFDRPGRDYAQSHVALGACDEEGVGLVNGGPPFVVDVTLVENVSRAGNDVDRAADLRVVDVGVGNVQDPRQIGVRIVEDVDFHAADTAVRLGPGAKFSQRDRRRVDQTDELATLVAGLAIQQAAN